MFTVNSDLGILYGNSNRREFLAHVRESTFLLSTGANDFFGTSPKSLVVVDSLVLVGKDSNWPYPDEKWWARAFNSDRMSDNHIGDRFPTKESAIKAAHEFAQSVLTRPDNN